jgi:hypothetical protein
METFYPAKTARYQCLPTEDALKHPVILNINMEKFCNEFPLS